MTDQTPQEISPHHQLRALVGQRFRYQGEVWTLIDVVADADTLVLRSEVGRQRSVQTNLYGTPTRRSPETITLPLSDADGGYSTALTELLTGRITV